MKKVIISALALATITLISWKSFDQKEIALGTAYGGHNESTYKLDAKETSLNWTGKYVADGHAHNGSVNVSEGSINFHDNKFESGSFVVDMGTIQVLDLPEDKKPMLTGHLQNQDFFNTTAFPQVGVKITGMDDRQITAVLTVLGKEVNAVMPVTYTKTDKTITASGKFDVDFGAAEVPGFKAKTGKPENQRVDSVISFDLKLVLKK